MDDGLLQGLVGFGSGFMKGMNDAEDRKYKRMEFDAKYKVDAADKEKKATEKKFDQAGKLRDDWLKNQTTKNSQTVKEAYDKIKTASPSAAGDMGLVFGYMKLLDPSSTVRESEYANASNTTGAAGKMAQMWNKVKDGQSLTPQQRAAFRAEADKIYQAQQKSQGGLDTQFRGLADTYGINQEEVVLRIFEDPVTGEQKVVPVPKSQGAAAQPQAKPPGLIKSKPAASGVKKTNEIEWAD